MTTRPNKLKTGSLTYGNIHAEN